MHKIIKPDYFMHDGSIWPNVKTNFYLLSTCIKQKLVLLDKGEAGFLV